MAPYILLIFTVCALDQLTKLWAMDFIAERVSLISSSVGAGTRPYPGDSVPILDGVLHFTYLENPGMSFGLLQDHRWIFMTVSTIAILAIFVYLCTLKGKNTLLRTSLSLIVGGGLGNMFDRVLLGYVVDFIDVRVFGNLWRWIFNLADAAVCVGAALLVIACITEFKKEKKKETAR